MYNVDHYLVATLVPTNGHGQ